MPEQNQPRATLRAYVRPEDEATDVPLILREHRNYPTRFKTMFHSTFERLSQMDRPPCYHRTLWHLLSVLDPIQFRAVSAREIAEATGQSIPSAERALAMLIADGMLITKGRTAARRLRLNNRLLSATSAERWNQLDADPEPEDARGR